MCSWSLLLRGSDSQGKWIHLSQLRAMIMSSPIGFRSFVHSFHPAWKKKRTAGYDDVIFHLSNRNQTNHLSFLFFFVEITGDKFNEQGSYMIDDWMKSWPIQKFIKSHIIDDNDWNMLEIYNAIKVWFEMNLYGAQCT